MTTATLVSDFGQVSRLAGKVHHAVDEAANRAAPAIDRASEVAHRAIDQVADTAIAAADRVSAGGGMLRAHGRELASRCGDAVRERPLAAIVGALAFGYLAGRLLR